VVGVGFSQKQGIWLYSLYPHLKDCFKKNVYMLGLGGCMAIAKYPVFG